MDTILDPMYTGIDDSKPLPTVLAGTIVRPPSPCASACSSPRADASAGANIDPVTAETMPTCQTGLVLDPATAIVPPTQVPAWSLPPIRLGLPFGSVLGDDSLWLVPPSPTAAEAHAAHTLSVSCRHAAALASGATAPVVGPGACQERAPAKRPRTAATASEVREQIRRDSAAKRLRVASGAPVVSPPVPEAPSLAALLLAALQQHCNDAEDDFEYQSPNAEQPCHSAASSAAPPPPHAAVLPHSPTVQLSPPVDSHTAAPLPYPIAQRYIQSFAHKLGWKVVGPEVALQPLYC